MSFVAVAVGTGAVGLAGSVFGAIKSGQANRANQRILNKQLTEARTDANRSFLDTATARDAVKQNNEALVDARKNVAGRAAITGASDESAVASNSAVTKNYNNAVSRLAGMGTQYQQRAKDRTNSLLGVQMGINSKQGESASALGANALGLAGTIAMTAGMQGGGGKGSGGAKGGQMGDSSTPKLTGSEQLFA